MVMPTVDLILITRIETARMAFSAALVPKLCALMRTKRNEMIDVEIRIASTAIGPVYTDALAEVPWLARHRGHGCCSYRHVCDLVRLKGPQRSGLEKSATADFRGDA